jgi:zinc D-Ala-D-Ala carboxypeptidase
MSMEKLKQIIRHERFYGALVGVVLILVVTSVVIFYYGNKHIQELRLQNDQILSHIERLDSSIASTADTLSIAIDDTKNTITNDLQKEKQNVDKITQQLGTYQKEVGELSGTLGNIEKLSKIDEELLQKYSKISFLNEHFKPVQLSEIPEEFSYRANKVLQVHSGAFPHLMDMFNAAKDNEIDLYAFSAFRSFNEQGAIMDRFTVVYGAGTASQFSADQGYSEHQLGTTLDFITKGIGGTLDGFGKTDAYTWMQENAYKYGFVLSYPKNNDFYIFEPWHWRFVGVGLAKHFKDTNQEFYDLEQREIDQFLLTLFD